MAKLVRRVYHLARLASLSPEVALSKLQAAGLKLNSTSELVPTSARARALQVLSGTTARPDQTSGATNQSFQQPRAPYFEAPYIPRQKSVSMKKGKGSRQLRRSVQRLTEADVLAIRSQMAKMLIARRDAFGSDIPIRPDQFSSAVQRQFTSAHGVFKYNTVPEVGATLTFGIAMNHPFENGNKRTALVSLLVLLNRNKTLLVEVTEDDLYDLIAGLVQHSLPIKRGAEQNSDSEVSALATWIENKSRELSLGDRKMDFSELREVLTGFGCTFDSPSGNFIKIKNGGYSVKTGYPRHDFEVFNSEVKRIRRALHLDETHGVDSTGFYNLEGAVDNFVNTHRNLMLRLADL